MSSDRPGCPQRAVDASLAATCHPVPQRLMGRGGMACLSIQEAAKQAAATRADVWLAIQAGALLAQRTDDGGLAIDPTGLFRVFEPQRPEERPMGQDGTAALGASERPEITPEANTTPEMAATNDMAVAFADPGLAPKGLVEPADEAPSNDELRLNPEEGQAADSAERNADLAEKGAERTKADKAMAKHAALEKRATPWWRRLVGWVRTRRGRAAQQRLRERL
jgi:hypothetical protein